MSGREGRAGGVDVAVRQIAFKSTGADTRDLCGWLYLPAEGTPRGVVQIAHGMAEHMGRYHTFMRMLAQNGWAACGMDHLGHGRACAAAELGFFAEENGWKTLLEDQYRFLRIVRTELGADVPHVMMGHSMGSFVARLFAAKYPQAVDALIVSGTAGTALRAQLAIRLADRSAKKNGSHYIDRGIIKLALGGVNDRFKPTRTKHDWLSREPRWVDEYRDDTLCGFSFTVSAMRDVFTLTARANDAACFAATRFDLPVLLFSGDMDPIGDYGRGPAAVRDRYLKAGVTDVTLILYTGGRHEMIGEVNCEQVWDDVLAWLNTHF